MSSEAIRVFSASAEDIIINPRELAARLKTGVGFENEQIERCAQRLRRVLQYRCAYIRTGVDLSRENVCDFGFMSIPSKHLYRNLSGCQEVFLLAVTTGIETDRLLMKLDLTSQAEHFMTDALASAAIESFCDYASDRIRQGLFCANRFSIGYGDVPLSFQKPFLERLQARQLLGITLNDAYFMTPVKSITAIMGIKNKQD